MSMRESCEVIEPLLAPYGEPDAAGLMTALERDRVRAHLVVCEPCRHQAEACRAVRSALRAKASELITPAPDRLAARCRAAAAPPRRGARWVGWYAGGAAAAAILLVFLMPTRAVATQLAVDHMKCAKFASGAAMTGTAGELERAWLDKRQHQVSIPEGNAAEGVRLVGLRRCVSTEGNMAHVMYERHGLPLSLFIFRTSGRGVPSNTQLETVGHKAILWTEGPNTYALIGRGQDLSPTAAFMQSRKTQD
jgi:anti-sigma factor RsiW